MGYTFTKKAVERIREAIHTVENLPDIPTDKKRSNSSQSSPPIWVEVVEADGTNLGRYKWKMKYVVGGTFADAGVDSGSDYTLWEVNGNASLPVGYRCLAYFVGYDGSSPKKPIYVCNASGCFLFRVKVSQIGGNAGSSSAYCSYTYVVSTLDDKQLGSGIAVDAGSARIVKAEVLTAATKGVAYFDDTGTLRLWDVDEKLTQTNC